MRKCRAVGCLLVAVCSLSAAEFQFGRAAAKITPTAETGGVKEVLDDLHAKAVVFEKDGTAAAIVVCDLPVMSRAVIRAARERIEKETGIPGGHVMVSATHSHTGFVPGWAGSSSFPSLMPPTAGVEYDEGRRYEAFLTSQIVQAVKDAYKDRKPAHVSAAVGFEDSLPFNRRYLMKDGSVLFNPGFNKERIVRPVGPIDPEIPIAYFETPEGQPLATMVNYAMHLDTVGKDAYSADYPHTLSKLLAAAKGEEMLTLFSIGTAGNINHLNFQGTRPRKGSSEPARIGTILAAAVLKTYPKLQRVEADGIRVVSETVPLPPIEIKPGEIEKAREIAARDKEGKPLTLLDRVFAQRIFFAEKQKGRPLDVEVQAIAIGNELAWVGLPSEVFVEIGMAIKRGSPFQFTTVNSLAYDWIRYTPNRKGLSEGAYEAINTRCGAGCGEIMIEAGIRCLLRLRGGRSDTPITGAQ